MAINDANVQLTRRQEEYLLNMTKKFPVRLLFNEYIV